jgi:hypothetical protein
MGPTTTASDLYLHSSARTNGYMPMTSSNLTAQSCRSAVAIVRGVLDKLGRHYALFGMQYRSHAACPLRMPPGRTPLFIGTLQSLPSSQYYTYVINLWYLRPRVGQPSSLSRDFQRPPPLTLTHYLRYNAIFGLPTGNCCSPCHFPCTD